MDISRLKSVILPLSGALILSGVAGTLYYFLTKKDDEEEAILKGRATQWTMAEVQVPSDAVGLVIGRQGSNVKLIQERTNTKINFSDEEVEGHRICTIKGSEDNVTLAQKLVIKAITDQPVIETEEMFVPIAAVGRIIGRNGETIRAVTRTSGAKVTVEREDEQLQSPTCPDDMRRIILKGSKEQIEAAKTQLLIKVAEEEEMRQQIQKSAMNMSLRARGRQNAHDSDDSQPPSMSSSLHQESLAATTSDRFIEAYVSAVDSAAHFWLQVVGSRSIQLDKLVIDMTEYYDSAENRELHELEKVKEGDIVAARFPHDYSWYRGQVCSYEHNDLDPSKSIATIYYVDFGDTEPISMENVCELRTHYLKLNFQAVECYLANIDPESVKGDEAADAFEELTYAAQWKIVMVKVLGYRQVEDKTIPCVQVIDTNGPTDVDVAEELVSRGLAQYYSSTS